MAYKGRVLDCLTDTARKFFKEEFRKDDQEASLRKIEFLIMDVVQPYRMGMFFFLFTTLVLGGWLGFQSSSANSARDQYKMVREENLKLRQDLDATVARLIVLQGEPKGTPNSAAAGLSNMASDNIYLFFQELIGKAQKKQITQQEVVRLIKVGAGVNSEFTIQVLKQNPILKNALSTADYSGIEKRVSKP